MAWDRALELVGKLEAAGLRATVDPRGATPPCVLVPPPGLTFDLACDVTARWSLLALVPGPGNSDAFKALMEMVHTIQGVLDVRTGDFISYAISADNPPVPAYRLDFEEAVEWR